MTKKMGVIESPNFPSNYSSNVNCEWSIVAPSNRKILVLIPEMNILKIVKYQMRVLKTNS